MGLSIVGGLDKTWNMNDAGVAINDGFADFAFAENDLFHPFIGYGGGPGIACLVIIVDYDSIEGVVHAKVLGTVFHVEKFLDAFVGGHEFGFAGTLGSLVLWNGAPGNGTAAVTDEVAGGRLTLEELKKGTIRDVVARLATSVHITESCKLMDLGL